jgi:chromosomal replication initiation ATPase DnaA
MPPQPRQLPLDLLHVEHLSRDDLVVTPANANAAALIDNWPDWPSPVVVLAGPPGCGKSHLAAVWRDEAGADTIDVSRLGSGPTMSGRPALIDGIGEKPFDQNGLFHLINAVRAGGSHLLLTTRLFPGAWRVTLPDLASRLKAATTVEIYEPDDALLMAVIAKLFADRQVEVDFSVVQYLVRRMERSLSTAITLVDRLDRAALEGGTRISRALAAQVLDALDESGGA